MTTTKKKDLRKTFKHKKVTTANNDVLYFDGKFNPETGVMKVYCLYGDVTKFSDAYDAIGIDYGCDKVLGK